MGFIQTVEKGKLTSHFGSFTVSLELPGDPSPPRRATHEDEVNTVENRAKTWIPHETTGTFSPMLPEARYFFSPNFSPKFT